MPSHWSAAFGGAECQVSYITKKLLSYAELDLTFLARRVNQSFEPNQYKIIQIQSCFKKLDRYAFLLGTKSLLESLNKIKPHVIYQRVACSYTGVAAWYAKKNNAKLIWHISHDMDVSPRTRDLGPRLKIADKKILEYGIRNATNIIAQTRTQSELLEKYYGRAADKVIKNFHPKPSEPIIKTSKLKVVWIANFKPAKQPELFVRLAKELSNKLDASFIMMGRIKSDSDYQKTLNDIKETDSLSYLGELEQSEVNNVLSSADLLVNTSVMEGFSNTFIQAWMREVPVVSLCVDPDDILETNRIGIKAGSYEKMCDAIVKLALEPELRAEMGRRGRQYALENHSLKNVDKIVELLR